MCSLEISYLQKKKLKSKMSLHKTETVVYKITGQSLR